MHTHALPIVQIFQPARRLSDWLTDWAKKLFGGRVERREAPRQMVTNLTANYWEGTAPGTHLVRDISAGGAFILADFKWVPGTIVAMTLELKREPAGSDPLATTAVEARVVRHAAEGVAVQFLGADKRGRKKLASFLQNVISSGRSPK